MRPFRLPQEAASPGKSPKPNIIITGTGLFASAGVTRIIWMSTLIAGKEELST